MEYKRLNTIIHSIEQVKLLAMSMYQISDETEFRKYFLSLALKMERLTNETRTATVLDADIDRLYYLSKAAESLDISVRKYKYAQATESVQQSFASGLATRLQIFQSEAIRNMTAFDDIDLTAPGKEKCAYFIVMSDQDSTYQLLSSLFFSFLFIKLADHGKTCPGQSLPFRVNMVLDELPSIGNIPELGRKLATVRKYGVNVIPIIQLISQLDDRYSEAERNEIIGCCDTQIWLGSNDIASAEVLSERSGTMTVDVSSKMEKAEFLPEVRLTATISPADTDDMRLIWEWSDDSVIRIDSTGTVSAIGAGKATITVKTSNNKTAVCMVTVNAKEVSKPTEQSSKPTESSKPVEASETKQLDPIYKPYAEPYDPDAIIADLRNVGEKQYGMVWEDSLWVKNRGQDYGSKYDDEWGYEMVDGHYKGNCQFYFPESTRDSENAADFRKGCLYTFSNIERDMKQNGDSIAGTRFKIVVEDVSSNYSGTEYWVYVLYT